MTNPRFGLIPLPLSMKNQAVPSEFMTDPNTGHLYIKQADGSAKSKTVDLENRIIALEKRATEIEAFNKRNEVYNDTVSIPGRRLMEFMKQTDIETFAAYGVLLSPSTTQNNIAIDTFSMGECSFELNIPLVSTNHDVYYIGVEYSTDTIDNPKMYAYSNQYTDNNNYYYVDAVRLTPDIDDYQRKSMHFFKIIPTVENSDGLLLKPGLHCYGRTIIYNIFVIKQKAFTTQRLTDGVTINANSYNTDYFRSKNRSSLKNLKDSATITAQTNNLLCSFQNPIIIDGRQLCLLPGWYSVNILLIGDHPLNITLAYKPFSAGDNYFSKSTTVNGVIDSSIQNYKYITCAIDIPNSNWYIDISPVDTTETVTIRDVTLTKLNTALYDHSKL